LDRACFKQQFICLVRIRMFFVGLEVARLVPYKISHYRIIEKLGAGGMGEVLLAQDVRLGRKVAIKILPAKSIASEQAKKRLFREARAAATLDHPNICAIYEVGEEGDCAYIAMQYIEGRTLSTIIKNNALSPLEVIDIGIQAAEALAEAHSRGVIHRDIKPHNVIITPRGQVKILDFGLAKILHDESAIHAGDHTGNMDSRLTETGEVVGTVGYMSPEQLRDLPIDGRTDLFSLGVMLYECVTGRSAFVGSTKIQISLQVIEVDPQRPSELSSDIPRELDDIIVKAIAKDVDDRYQSAAAMLADLRRVQSSFQASVLNTRPLTARPGASRATAPGSLSRKMSRKMRTAPVMIKVGLILVPLVILGGWWAVRVARPSVRALSPDARRWYEDGTRAMRDGAFYEARRQLEQSISIDDKFAPSHARLAQTYLELDNIDKAREELLRALSLASDRGSLARTDSTYIDAVSATVGREFTKAIDYYHKLADEAPDSEKASAYVDVGRAYERNDNIDKAQDYYRKAIDKDSQYPAAYLRLAILSGRRLDSKNADDAFNEAERLYKLMTKAECVAEVFYQRGALLAKTKQLSEARKNLEEALKNLPADNNYQLVKIKLQLSAVYYDEGDTERAKNLATEAIELAQKNKAQDLVTNGMIELGYTVLSRGDFDEADKLFRKALAFAQTDRARSSEARAMVALGALSEQQRNPDGAIPMFEEALKFYQEAGYRREASNALLSLARAYRDKGDYEVAIQTFEQQVNLATELDDQAQLSAAHLSIATLLGVEQERYPEALAHLNTSYEIDSARGSKLRSSYDQMNRANMLWQLGRYKDANDALAEASAVATQPEASYKILLAWVHLTYCQMALSERRYAVVREKGRLALEVAGTQYRDIALSAKSAIALADALSNSPRPARQMSEDAVATARNAKTPRVLSSALLAFAEVLLLANDAPGSLKAAQEALLMFERGKQQDSQWRASLIAASASLITGDKAAAQQYASRAAVLCDGLRQVFGDEAYESYLRRPDIQAYRRQLDQVFARSK
jgi:serine/threonine protein kinase/tetratricopeptide (TPR) repeat protein